MQRLDILASLPTSLSCTVLRDWLDCKTVATLNSACCCKSSRPTFLQLSQADEYFLPQQVTISSKSKILKALKVIGNQIRSVKLGENLTFDEGLLVAKNCSKFQHVHFCTRVSCNPHILSGNLFTILKNNQRVQSLTMKSIDQLGRAATAPSFHDLQLTQLNSLVLNGFEIENEQILCLMKKCNIKKLDLSNSAVGHSILLQIPEHCPNLTALGLANTRLSDETLHAITSASPNIVHIDISCNNDLTDAGILSMVRNLKNLQSLNIEYSSTLTDASLRHIYTYCASTLQTLYLHDRSEDASRDEGINELLERCGNLRTLMLDVFRRSMFLLTKPSVIQNLTTLLLVSDTVNLHNVEGVSKYGANLEVLCIQIEENLEISEQIFPTDLLLSVYNTCAKLRRLYINMKEQQDEEFCALNFGQAFLKLWEQTRPGLVIDQGPQQFEFSVTMMK